MNRLAVLAGAFTAMSAAAADAQQAAPSRQYGVAVAAAVTAAPLGEVARSYGLVSMPGLELDARLLARSANGSEWSVGVLTDHYETDLGEHNGRRWGFDYTSAALVGGRSWLHPREDVALRSGLELGWRYFSASSARRSVYDGEFNSSSVNGHAALLAVAWGIEIPSPRFIVSPRLRIETNYPDFGGGDGYSELHRESDLGFRASAGIELKSLRRR